MNRLSDNNARTVVIIRVAAPSQLLGTLNMKMTLQRDHSDEGQQLYIISVLSRIECDVCLGGMVSVVVSLLEPRCSWAEDSSSLG